MGLRYPKAFNAQLLRGVRRMKESVTYQAIMEEGEALGRIAEARRALLRVGTKRLGAPPATVEESLAAIESVERLEALLDRVLEVETWNDLLQIG